MTVKMAINITVLVALAFGANVNARVASGGAQIIAPLFTFDLKPHASGGYYFEGICDVGRKVVVKASHSSYTVGMPAIVNNEVIANQLEEFCGNTKVVPKIPQTTAYPVTTPFTIVYSTTPVAPMPSSPKFKAGSWTFEASEYMGGNVWQKLPAVTVNLP